jgi:hypothetical protein
MSPVGTQSIPSTTATFAERKVRRSPLQSLKNMFRKPKTTANFDLEGKKVKLSTQRAAELAKKYEAMDKIEDRAYNVLLDLDLIKPTKP